MRPSTSPRSSESRGSSRGGVTPTSTALPPASGFSLTGNAPRPTAAAAPSVPPMQPRVAPREKTVPATPEAAPRPRPPSSRLLSKQPAPETPPSQSISNPFAELNASLRTPAPMLESGLKSASQLQQQQQLNSPQRSKKSLDASEVTGNGTTDVLGAKFRSTSLQLEIALRELIADGNEMPPSEARVKRIFKLYDTLINATPIALADLLRMFRVEFCRSIFSPVQGAGATDFSTLSVPFFERFESLLRENNMLNAELTAAENAASTEQLQHQVQKLQSLGSYYEHEITRLTRENDRLREECDRMTKDIEVTANNNQKVFVALDAQNHRLAKEARELQLQVFRLHKEARDQVANQNLYAALRTAKMEELSYMWDSGHELSGLLLTLHQLEGVLNGLLTTYEHKIVKASIGEMSSNRTKFIKEAQYVLDEYHEVNKRRNAIEAIAEGRGDEPIDANSDAWQRRSRQSQSIGLLPEPVFSFPGAQQEISVSFSQSTPFAAPAPPPAKGDGRRWAEAMFGAAIGGGSKANPAAQAVFHGDPWKRILSWDPKAVSKYQITNPLFVVGGDRFMAGVDLYTATGGGDYSCLKSFPWLDPSVGIELPSKATHVKIKFHNPMVKDAARNFGAEDIHRLDATKDGDMVKRWRPAGAPSSEGALEIARLVSNELSPSNAASKPKASSIDATADGAQAADAAGAVVATSVDPIDDTHWEVFRDRYGAYEPFLPRKHPIELVDVIMMQTFALHSKNMKEQYSRCLSIAQGRSSGAQMLRVIAERFFRDEFHRQSLQRCFFDVIEAFFSFPEVVMKVSHELLTTMEAMSRDDEYPHVRVYLGCLGGSIAPPLGRVLAVAHVSLSQYWPLASVDRHVPVQESDLLAVVKGLYPTEASIRVSHNDITADIMLFSDGKPTLELVKRFFTEAFLQLREPVLLKCHEAVVFKSTIVHWSELDVQNFWEAVRSFCSEDAHDSITVQHIISCCIYDRQSRLPPEELAHIATEVVWLETAKLRPSFR